MKLKELLTGISVLECTADPELEIKEIFYDSRKVTPGSLFVAVSGFATDGNKFIPMAAEKGAAAVVTAKKPETDIPYVLVESDRLALALLGCNFFGRPAEHMTHDRHYRHQRKNVLHASSKAGSGNLSGGEGGADRHHGQYDRAGDHPHRANHPGEL